MSHATNAAILKSVAECLDRLRTRALRVHAITSPVAAERTANTLLALGVTPTLTVNPDEVSAFVTTTDAVLINLGMLDPLREVAASTALNLAKERRKPVVLDPVFVNLSETRRQFALELLGMAPTVFKANLAEAAMAEQAPEQTVRVITGARDFTTYLGRHVTVENGHPMSQKVTAMGCALGAVIAAFLAVEEDPLMATVTALMTYGVAGELAARISAGPGSFATAFLDALAAMDGKTLIKYGRIA